MKDFWRLPVVCGLLVLAGCGEKSAPAPQAVQPAAETASAEDHSHGIGPHGGLISDWGGGAYHVEFAVDHDKQEAVVHILGSDAKTRTPIKASKLLLSINEPAYQMELAAQPLEGETSGASSRFVGQHQNLGTVQEFAGTITGEVGGTPYAGDFDESAGGHVH